MLNVVLALEDLHFLSFERKVEAREGDRVPLQIDEHYLGQWMTLGMAQLDAHLKAYAQFHAWLAEHRPDLLPCGRRCRMRRICRARAARHAAGGTPGSAAAPEVARAKHAGI
jgi:hypothetical protein